MDRNIQIDSYSDRTRSCNTLKLRSWDKARCRSSHYNIQPQTQFSVRTLFPYLRHHAVLILIKAFHEKVRRPQYFDKIFLGKTAIFSSKLISSEENNFL